ncbi:LacI family DNA-binding transcriptional regulator [Bifidobacterium oedipodis]|uniref:LacI family transcriptional regulator n=1 Tax=Bifidobacterium oedipodis TaxID=2675322 RepID=A0A7Y0ERD7_9BIFI|nr:LacI family DNA-binding transcriptional regulator [Bifidobacterium sp. DSM 109957]NMM95017.1 LacI family transcriptional regulator [Bifidobacterium sp. DSM 109957]
MVTMRNIAEQVGVSISTVSLVLSDKDRGRVRSDIAQRIRQAALELGYQPNRLASGLRTNHSRIIGFLSNEVATTPFAGRMLEGAQDAALALGYMLLTINVHDNDRETDREITALKQYGTDGFIYARMFNQSTVLPAPLDGCRTVIANGTDAEGQAPSIIPDEYHIGLCATNHLIETGCKRIAYIGTVHTMIAQSGRVAGYLDALSAHGIPFDPEIMINVDDGADAAARLPAFFNAHTDLDGFFCFNDTRAWGVYEEAAHRGLVIGKDIAVVGVDNHEVIAEAIDPPLSSVELPHYEMGYWAVGKLVSMLQGETPEPFPCAGYPINRAQLPPLTDNHAKITCQLRIKQSWFRRRP